MAIVNRNCGSSVRNAVWLAAILLGLPWALAILDVGLEGKLQLTTSALAQDADDDDGDGDDDDDGGGGGGGGGGPGGGGGGGPGGGGGGGGGPGAGPGGADEVTDFDDGENIDPRDCFEENMLLPSWLRDCERRRVVRQRAAQQPAIAKPPRQPATAAPTRTLSPAGGTREAAFSPGQIDISPAQDEPDALRRELVLLDVSEQEIAALEARGFVILQRAPQRVLGGTLIRVRVPADTTTPQGLSIARQIAPGALADLNHIYRPGQGACNSPACRQRELVGWPKAPEACLLEAQLGVIDTSIDRAHPALAGQNIEIINGISGNRRASSTAHGTAIAALLAGRADGQVPGLLPRATVVAIEAFHQAASGDDIADTYDIVRALDTLFTRGLSTINLSLTGPDNQLLARAVDVARGKDIVLVASAGNQGPTAEPAFPAAYDGAVAVTAVGADLRVYRRANRGNYIDLAGPGVGVEVVSAGRATRFETGTSFATPFITVAVVGLRKRLPQASSSDILAELQRRASDLGRPGRDAVFGWGLLQAGDVCQ
ncbi:MAG: S8 family serine peptidase [Alphaproteobacteria bacterium]|nr:S8 family serine peptidase [Alphaproteobacteria bacterium]